MESVILWILMVAVGLFLEKRKKARKHRQQHEAQAAQRGVGIGRPAPCASDKASAQLADPWAAFEHWLDGGERKSKSCAEAAKAKPKATPAPARHTAYQPLPAEGGSIFDDMTAIEAPAAAEAPAADVEGADTTAARAKAKALTPEEEASRRKAHFDRWRRAVIDMQLLQPKFNEY